MHATMIVATLAALAFVAASASATQYVVDPLGDDTHAGTAAAPWQTLQRAANVVGPGDRVTVHGGNYVGFNLTKSGTAVAPIEFDAQPGVLVTQRSAKTPDGINLENASHVIIDGFGVTAMPRAGVRSVGVDGDEFASFVTIRNVHAYDNARWGIFTGFVNDLLIESNVTSGSVAEHGIYVSNSGDRPVIRNNTSFNNHGSGIHMNGDLSQGGDGLISGALVTGNIIFNNAVPRGTEPGGGSGINMDGVQNSRIENNLLYNNHASGISLYDIDGAAGSSGNVVVNNTIDEASDGRWALNIQTGSTGNTVLNNILVSEHPSRGAIDISSDSLSGFTSDYNAVISRFTTNGGGSVLSLAGWKAQTGQDSHSLTASTASLFQNPAAGVYQLQSTAPAVNAGTSLNAPAFDLDGTPRPIGAAFDIGAYEFLVAALDGDYNHDGVIDAADYTVWRDTLGSTTNLVADGNGNRIVDAGDYGVWNMNFGTGGAGTSSLNSVPNSIPEPTTIAMLSSAAFLVLLGRRNLIFR